MLTLLYVEDHPVSVQVMEGVMALTTGWQLLHAALVETGVAAARAHHPDLVVIDMHLPDGTGRDVLMALKSDAATRDIPAVILTAGALDKEAIALLDAGAEQFWTKPHDLDLMLDYFDEVAARARR